MASLTRVQISDVADPTNAFALSLATFEPGRSKHVAHSRVDQAFIDWTLRRARDCDGSNIDPAYLEVLVSEVSRKGPPRPIETTGAARWISNPLHLEWDGFHWRQRADGFELAFSPTISSGGCQLRLRPTVPDRVMDLSMAGGMGPAAMTLHPRLRAEGTVGNDAVWGEAWLEYRSRDFSGWVSRSREGRMLGYDWFSLHLKDGSDWMVLSLRDAEGDTPIVGRAGCWVDGGQHITKTLTLKTLRSWESPATRIRYPVERRLEVPELDAELWFVPLLTDQEIGVLDPSRAIWHGAGTVRGTIAGRPVRGHARAAFAGYGHVFDFQRYLEPLQGRVDRRIEEFFPRSMDEERLQRYLGQPSRKYEPKAYGVTLSEPVWDLMSRRGKRWRPIFGLLVLEALDTVSEPYEALLCNLAELTHTGALIIDDIEDSSEIRRGQKTIHLKYGTDVAVNAGNTLYFLPSLLIENHARLSDQQRIQLYQIVIRQFVRAHFGQALDIYWSREMKPATLEVWVNESLGPKILQMYEHKTAAAVAGLAEAAAVIAMVDVKVREACACFARAFGVSFQMLDDTHNFSRSPKWGKTTGEDLAEGKLTYAIYRALDSLVGADQRRLREIVCSRELRADGDIVREGAELVRQSGALEACRKEAAILLEEAWSNFASYIPSSEPKMMLRMLCVKLLELAYDV
jgi:geranylgeranyl pyrophosphate synthase